MNTCELPLLPLILAEAPVGLAGLLEQEGVPTRRHQAGSTEGRFVLYDSRRADAPPLANGQTAIDVHFLRELAGGDPWRELADSQAELVRWSVGHLLVREQVARVDRRVLRQRLLGALRARLERAGGVWMRVGAFPFPYRTAFNFRFDHDVHLPADFDAALDALEGHEAAASHYVCGAAYEPQPEALARLRGQDVGAHGYYHHTYPDAESNRRNIARGLDVLRRAGIRPSGFVAPHGRYNQALVSVLGELGITHSSEFGFAYDELPLWPAGANVLQVPVHPICLGLCLDAAARLPDAGADELRSAADAMAGHFCRLAVAKHAAGEPIFFYGHPDRRLGRYPWVLSSVLRTIEQLPGIWPVTLTRFAEWWRARSELRVSVERQGDRLTIRTTQRPLACEAVGELVRDEGIATLRLDGAVVHARLEQLSFEPRPPRPPLPCERLGSPRDLRSFVCRWLDWEKETPIDEIYGRPVRSWMKRTLRRIRSR
jgi:peptidoglycan/xylan/chitin deacetylase (PgdA/CDA1 family)